MFRSKGIDPEVVALRERVAKLEVLVETVRIEYNKTWGELKDAQSQVQTIPPWSKVPLHLAEEAEDAAWLRDSGRIDESEYREILEAAGLEPNIEIHY